jgi:hypothetical protein
MICMLAVSAGAVAQEYSVVTTIESVAAGGFFTRSRMVDHKTATDYKPLTTERINGVKPAKDEAKKDDEIKIEKFEETQLLNLYHGYRMDFQNVASNDAVISSKLTEMAKDGWQLLFVTSSIESDSGSKDGFGIFITRYIFKK